jgi:L-ascorbate metabolism protein UlaG (beta-lactamase superfamily)
MGAMEAARALKLIRPKAAIPMHYGTFPILEQRADRFLEFAKKYAPDVKIVILEPGESYTI